MRIRLSEIAERSGVSISTVSRVLNERPGVSPQARRQVLTAIDVLGYDRPARLRPRVGGLVGLVLPELENPFFPRLAHHLEISLARMGLSPVLCSQTLGGVHEDDYVAILLEHSVAGIVFVSGVHALVDSDPARYQRLLDLHLPIVLVNGALTGLDAPSVSTDDAVAVDLAVQHLEHMGHRRIGAALGQMRYLPAQRKRQAFVEALTRHGLVPGDLDATDLVESTTYTVQGGQQAAERLLDRGVTGIVCGSDVMALGVMRSARMRGLRVPEDLSVVGCDDSQMMEFVDPPLTTVRQPAEALAQAASQEIAEQISGIPPHAGEVLYRPELVVRGSTASVAGPR
ncbi:LacI family DNA-binding transcriptional regulator [Nocardioides alpinus]|uniref:LacI family transcriptional regulator n=1 Tax=Nocardioides alpinus TaxID=748909 RepID=A0ABX4QV82_9ACTN|nr:LacI family DNA-binding transcriptional regulator [Nocardioides alpinus]PKH39629.1 LacI family transcriptional regulator [Nocardioides alpinus]